MNLYERLNVQADATPAEIKKSYRKEAKKHHPDKPDGDTETMQAVQHAYAVLRDAEARARYDRTGDDSDQVQQDPVEAAMVALFAGLVTLAMSRGVNVIDHARTQLNTDVRNMKERINAAKKDREKLKALLPRVSCSEEVNFFEMAVEGRLGTVENSITEHHEQLKLGNKLLSALDKYTDSYVEKAMSSEEKFAQIREAGFNPLNMGFGGRFTRR